MGTKKGSFGGTKEQHRQHGGSAVQESNPTVLSVNFKPHLKLGECEPHYTQHSSLGLPQVPGRHEETHRAAPLAWETAGKNILDMGLILKQYCNL